MAEPYFNPFDPAFRADPYPHYKPLVAGPPRLINLRFPIKIALAARYSDVVTILRDPVNFSSRQLRMPELEKIGPFAGAPTVLFSDPPVHTRLRRLIVCDFSARRIREIDARVCELTDGMLDKVAARGSLEVMQDLAEPLPVMVIAEMLGVPPDHYPQFKRWSNDIVAGANTIPGLPLPQSTIDASAALRAYFAREIERRRITPGPDLISALVAAHDEAEALTSEELLAFVVLILLAGNETTTNLIGNGMLALGRHPQQLERLRSEPELLDSAIDEILRYDGPVQTTARLTRAPVSIGEAELPAMTGVFVLLAAANRDPAQFPDPERFDIARTPNDHVAFGEGIHFCIGAALARLEGSIAIGSLVRRFPRLRLADPAAPVEYKGSFGLRGLSALPMAID